MRIIVSIILYTFFTLFASNLSFAKTHLVLKSDFNGDGTADRVVFASYGISGFVQSTFGNKKIDTFFLKQGNRSIFFTSNTTDKVPYLKLTEEVGFFSVITLMKYENRQFKYVASYSLAERAYFSDDFLEGAVITTSDSVSECKPNSALEDKATTTAQTWAEKLKQHSLEESVRKSIDSSCKKVFGSEYEKIEKEIISACKIESTPSQTKQNSLIACLDKNEETRTTSSAFQRVLAANMFEDGFKVNCEDIKTEIPKASFNKAAKTVSLYQTSPSVKNRSFKEDFFHEMLHSTGIKEDDKIQPLVRNCLSLAKRNNPLNSGDRRYYTTNLREEAKNVKDGVEFSIPPETKQIPQNSVANAVAEGSKTLDKDFSMDNPRQFDGLRMASIGAFKSIDPIMRAAYEAAIPTAFAKGTLSAADPKTVPTASVSLPTVKAAAGGAIRSISSVSQGNASQNSLSGAIYDVSSLPESIPASEKGELGNGLYVKAATIQLKEGATRSPSSTATGGAGEIASAGGLGQMQSTDRADLQKNVPRLKVEEDFIRILTTGKYADVKAKLTDPANQKIMEDKKIQYLAKDKTLGSKQPDIILKDLGSKFSILRINVE